MLVGNKVLGKFRDFIMKLCNYMIFIFLIIPMTISCHKKDPPTKPDGTAIPDTTSHDFEWQITYLGQGSSSYLKDVAIIDENNIWAVGEIYLKDSTGKLIQPPYNIIHWDGTDWKLTSVEFYYYYGKLYTSAECIFCTANNNIIASSGGGVILWNGNNWENTNYLFDQNTSIGYVYKLWGLSIDNLWGVGLNGSIVHYNGTIWQKLESTTTQPINDIWGVYNPNTQQSRIFCVASDKYHGGEKKVLQIMDDLTVQEFDWTPQKSAHSVWFGEDTPLYVCGGGVHIYEDGQWREVSGFPNYYTNRVRGNHQNDVFVAGEFGLIAHYNGVDWKIYDDPKLPKSKYRGLAVKDNIVAAVGDNGYQAFVCIGKRKK